MFDFCSKVLIKIRRKFSRYQFGFCKIHWFRTLLSFFSDYFFEKKKKLKYLVLKINCLKNLFFAEKNEFINYNSHLIVHCLLYLQEDSDCLMVEILEILEFKDSLDLRKYFPEISEIFLVERSTI